MTREAAAQHYISKLTMANPKWKQLAIFREGEEGAFRLMSRIVAVTVEPALFTSVIIEGPAGEAFNAHIFTESLLLSFSATADQPVPVVSVVPRHTLRKLEVLSAPVVITRRWEDEWPLTVALQYDGERVTLNAREGDESAIARLGNFLQTLIDDLSAETTGLVP